MVNLKYWVMNTSIEDIIRSMVEYYPDEPECNLVGYVNLHEQLLQLDPEDESTMIIRISPYLKVCDECTIAFREIYTCSKCPLKSKNPKEDEISRYDVYGYDPEKPETPKWGLDLSSRSVWLSYLVDDDIINKYGASAVLAHIYWEMTFIGWEENDVQEVVDSLEESSRQIEEAKASGNWSQFKSWDELKRDLGFDLVEYDRQQKQRTEKMLEMARKIEVTQNDQSDKPL